MEWIVLLIGILVTLCAATNNEKTSWWLGCVLTGFTPGVEAMNLVAGLNIAVWLIWPLALLALIITLLLTIIVMQRATLWLIKRAEVKEEALAQG